MTKWNKHFEIGLLVAVSGTALAFGGVQPWTYSLVEVALFSGIFLLLLLQVRTGRLELPIALPALAFLLWIAIELVPLPSAFVNLISPARLKHFVAADGSVHVPSWTTLSIYPYYTKVAILKWTAYLSAFVLATYVFDSARRKSLLIRGFIVLALFEATYGAVQYLTGWQKIFAYSKVDYTTEATGTYINHNHFAGMLSMAIPFVAGLIFFSFQIWSSRRRDGISSSSRRGWASPGIQTLLYLFVLLVLVVGVSFSRSRSGIVSGIISILFVALLAQLRTRRTAWLAGLLIFMFVALSYGFWIGLAPVFARFQEMGQSHYLQLEGRLSFWKDSLGIIRDYPLAGVGLGNFGLAFRQYQTDWVTYFIDHAHNDYLELVSETGLVGGILLFVPVYYLLVRMIIFFLRDQRRYRPTVVLGCIGATLSLLMHSLTDFNLQIPANALIFAVVLGIGYKATVIEPAQEASEQRPTRRTVAPGRTPVHSRPS